MPIRSDDEKEENASTGGRRQYHVSASKLASLFGKNRSTITDWIADG